MTDRPFADLGHDSLAAPRPAASRDSRRLFDAYDHLLDAPDAALEPREASELSALAGVYDLDVDRPQAEVWSELRALITKSSPALADPSQVVEPMTILVVEDDPDTAADLTEALTDAGHSVVGPFHAAEPAEAAAALHSIDVALLDINLSGEIDGTTLARALKDRWGLPVIFLSGDVTAIARHADLAEALVLKPYSAADVLDALAHLQAEAQRKRA
jgi:CheY-like chemotaxis protein